MKPNLLFVLILLWVGCQSEKPPRLIVAAAANVQFAMADLEKVFEEQTRIPVEVIIGSSGKLSAQLSEGAPFGVFVSADRKYPEALFEEGIGARPPAVYATGSLVLWTVRDDLASDLSLETLLRPEVQKIALANPQLAPYGQAAEEVLRHYGYLEQLRERLVFGESISQTTQYVQSRAADIGFTAKAVVLSQKLGEQGKWIEFPAATYTPIEQAALLLDTETDSPASAFYDFLFSEEAQAIFLRYGYLIPE